jgi:hypothetical protein
MISGFHAGEYMDYGILASDDVQTRLAGVTAQRTITHNIIAVRVDGERLN